MKRLPLPILIGRGISRNAAAWTSGLCPSRRLLLVSEPGVWRRHGGEVRGALRRAGWRTDVHLLPRGERAKTWDAVAGLLGRMLRLGLGRDAALTAMGGGAVTDAAGFAAAIYMRGIPWISLPTTLLGQIDGGIGGKTGIDLPAGKNLAGAFHMPRRTVCDTAFLDSLPPRERFCGLIEAAKLGLVCDPGLVDQMRACWLRLLTGDPAATQRLVRRAARGKARIVAGDPRETKGLREILNFGHTLGHALEAAAGFSGLRHGEAVLLGMRAALRLSRKHAGLRADTAEELDSFLSGLPVPRLRLREAAVMAALRRDKKARAGRLRFVLLPRVGRAVAKAGLPDADIRGAVRGMLEDLL